MPGLPVDEVFRLARREGCGHELEMLAVTRAPEKGLQRPAGTRCQ